MLEIIKIFIKTIISQPPIYWIIIILGILVGIFYKKFRGFMGEFWVKRELQKLPKDSYIVLNDIMLKSKNKTSQMDHIVISKYGIFVIEMKNYFGLVTGNEYNDKWIQHMGKKKFYFKNPIHQNYGHIQSLKEVLGLDDSYFISIICFSNQATLKVNTKTIVTQLDFLISQINSYSNNIIIFNLNEIKEEIQRKNILNKNIRKTHIKNIRKDIKTERKLENDMICPKCGNKLLNRKSKYGEFIGCSNFPHCKYIKK